MLKLTDIHCSIDKTPILRGVNLEVGPGEIHVLMGSNGSGKSTLAKVLGDAPGLSYTGKIELNGADLSEADAAERSIAGVFVANQYPVEVPGVNFGNFLRMAYNAHRSDSDKVPVFRFRNILRDKAAQVGLSDDFLDRNLNEGLSGGEKKKSEILQLAVLEPKYAVLDETDSGLDIDALKIVFSAINKIKEQNSNMGLIVITHYQKVFEYLTPNKVHVMHKGQIVASGGMEIVEQINNEGYKAFAQ